MKRIASLLLCAGLTSAPAIANAQVSLDQARTLFSAGAAAYDKHDYLGAIRAFEGANQIAPRPAIGFSLAQAHRRQFYVDGNPTHQKAAIELFKDYVKEVPNGGRHEDAMRALQELGALSPQQEVASVSINASGTAGARVALDGAAPVEAPLIGPVSAGKHRATISADGFVTEVRELTAVNGQIVALDVPLKEKAAHVELAAPNGAVIAIDGRAFGETPLRTIELPSGAHVVSLVKNGHEAFSAQLELARGEDRHLDARMPSTRQRAISIGMLVASGVVAVGGATCAVMAAVYLGQANGILARKGQGNIPDADRLAYDDDRELRGDFLVAAGIGFATAGLLAATGLVLYAFDTPSPTNAIRNERMPKPTEHKAEPAEISIAPVFAPNMVGASALVRF